MSNIIDKKHLHWRERSRQLEYDAKIFKVIKAERETYSGQRASFYLLDTPDWVNIVPITRNPEGEDCFIMVWQYRQGSENMTLEFPGGVIDPGEDPRTAAVRELREETGYVPGKIHFGGKIQPNPAFHNNWCHTYIAEDVHKAHEQELDENELVEYELVPISEVQETMGTGPHIHAIMVVALHWYHRWLEGRLGDADWL